MADAAGPPVGVATGAAPAGTDLGADEPPVAALFADVVGQDAAVAELRAAARRPTHGYLLLGPPGSGTAAAARGFAAALLCPRGGCGGCRSCRLALAGTHPDLVEVRRSGASITVAAAREVVVTAARVPMEALRQVVVLHEVHLLQPAAAATLLKTFEEPPPSTVFVALADDLVPDLVTLASRCVRVAFGPVPEELVAARLVEEGADEAVARLAARAARGDLARARLLAGDPELEARRQAWAAVPSRLDGSGAAVAVTVAELLAGIEEAAGPLRRRHEEELAELAARAARFGERASGRAEVEERHKRELRRHRTDEILSGLATLAGVYRDRLAEGGGDAASVRALAAVQAAAEGFERNANEVLLLQALLVRVGGTTG